MPVEDGCLMLPPMSEPIPSKLPPEAIKATSPPEEPPAERIGECGLRVTPGGDG